MAEPLNAYRVTVEVAIELRVVAATSARAHKMAISAVHEILSVEPLDSQIRARWGGKAQAVVVESEESLPSGGGS